MLNNYKIHGCKEQKGKKMELISVEAARKANWQVI